jgi:hypothetical protein
MICETHAPCDGGGQGQSVDAVTLVQSVIGYTKVLCQPCDRPSRPLPADYDVRSHIPHLSDFGCPLTIPRPVWPAVVDAVQCEGRGTGTHISGEAREVVPPLSGDHNAACAVEGILPGVGIVASALGSAPRPVLSRRGAVASGPVSCVRQTPGLGLQAPAASRGSASEVPRVDHLRPATVTAAAPENLGASLGDAAHHRDGNQSAETLSGNVNQYHRVKVMPTAGLRQNYLVTMPLVRLRKLQALGLLHTTGAIR